MRRLMIALVATSIFSAVAPVIAAEQGTMDSGKSMQFGLECDMLLKSCVQEVDSIQERIQKIKAAIETYGAKPEYRDELVILNKKLKEANDMLRELNKPGH